MIKKKLVCFLVFVAIISSSAAQQSEKKITYYYTDPQGSVLAIADQNGVVTSSSDYLPYGDEVGGVDKDGPSYTSHVRDTDTGLLYMQARYFDLLTGPFLSIDPNGISVGSVLGIARYTYGNNNPYVFIDPDGRQNMYALAAGVTQGQMLESGDPNAARHVEEINAGQAQVVATVGALAVVSPAAGFVARTAVAVAVDSAMSGSIISGIVGSASAVTASGVILADGVAAASGTTTPMSPEINALGAELQLSSGQAANLRRFESKLPTASTGTHLDSFGDGVLFTANVPGKVSGSSAVYQKSVDGAGNTTGYLKTTFLPNGDVAHIKDKITPTQ